MDQRDGEIIYVVCFYWQGDRWQQRGYVPPEGHVNLQQGHMDRSGRIADDLPARYVNNLYGGVKRFASRPFKFICFTNEPLDVNPEVEVRPFTMVTHDGVLPRLCMFSEAAGLFEHQVLCFDLDIVITGSLKHFMDYEGLFCARSKFKPGERHKLDGDIMSFRAGRVSERVFWTPFINDLDAAVARTQGRERYWVREVANDIAERWDTHAPNEIMSYKWGKRRKHITRLRIPNGVSIVSCHGVPRPHEIKDRWIKQYWK